MASIDTSKIEGYADMTAEQKLAALESYDIPEPDYSGYVKKDLYDKAAHEAADWKKKHNALISDDEQAAQAAAEEAKAKDDKIAELSRMVSVNDNTAKFLALGFDADLAKETAEAMADGNTELVFANQKKATEAMLARQKAELLKSAGNPVGDNGNSEVDYDAKARKCLDAGDAAGFSYYNRLACEKANAK